MALQRAGPATQFHPVGRGCDDRAGPGQVTDELAALAGMGFQVAIGAVARVWEVSPLEIIGRDVIRNVASL